MKFAVNYSPDAQKLLDQGAINIDFFKCPDFDEDVIQTAQQYGPAYVHFPLNAGQNNLDQVDWDRIERLFSQTNTPYINMHLVAYAAEMPSIPADTTKRVHKEYIKERLIRDIEKVSARFGAEKVILENVVYQGIKGKMLLPVIDPDLIAEVVRQTKCGLLLDIAHVQLSSKYKDFDVYEYLATLPIERLRELHVTGIQRDDKRYRDSMPMTDDDWRLAEWTMARIHAGEWSKPWVVSFEYGGVGPAFEWRTDIEVLKQQVPRLHDLVYPKLDGRREK